METEPQITHVVVHTPGPAWEDGVAFREPPGVMAHVEHYARLNAEGRLWLGGPFLTAAGGGMMVASPAMERDELETFAAADPAVRDGLLRYEVRPWYVAMQGR